MAYGNIHRVSDFLSRTIPKRGQGEFKKLFVHQVVQHLKQLDKAQADNAWITLSVNASDGIWLSYQGRRIYLTLPAMNRLRILVPKYGWKESQQLNNDIRSACSKGAPFSDISHSDYYQWHAEAKALPVLEHFFLGLAKPEDGQGTETGQRSHARYFPGIVRQAAMEAFERGGNFCPGVDGKVRRHLVDRKKIDVEFDHIYPRAKGGSNTQRNVQVLCEPCNRLKRDSAL